MTSQEQRIILGVVVIDTGDELVAGVEADPLPIDQMGRAVRIATTALISFVRRLGLPEEALDDLWETAKATTGRTLGVSPSMVVPDDFREETQP